MSSLRGDLTRVRRRQRDVLMAATAADLTTAEVGADVVHFVAGFAHYPAANVRGAFVLREAPLFFDDNRLAFLASALRSYVRQHEPGGHLAVSAVRKQGLDVTALIGVVTKALGL